MDSSPPEFVILKVPNTRNADSVTSVESEASFILHVIKPRLPNPSGIVRIIDILQRFRTTPVIVMELLGPSLLDRLRGRDQKGLGIVAVQSLARQVLSAVHELHSAGILHADIKPENILYVDDTYESVKLIDFGSAETLPRESPRLIQSLWYRAPEVVLQVESTEKVDLWSVGCVLYEAFMGNPLFAPDSPIELLNRIVSLFGGIPPVMVDFCPVRSEFFNANGSLKTVVQYYRERREEPPKAQVRPWVDPPDLDGSIGLFEGAPSETASDPEVEYSRRALFVSFLYGLLAIHFGVRLSAEQALKDPFLTTDFKDP
jgi:serine/threonine protein kinase